MVGRRRNGEARSHCRRGAAAATAMAVCSMMSGFSQAWRFEELIPTVPPAVSAMLDILLRDGGLPSFWNLAVDGCIVKSLASMTASWVRGAARIFESRGCAVEGIWQRIKAGDVVVGALTKGRGEGRACRRCLPDQLPQVERAGKVCALVTDGRFSGGSSGLSIGHLSPEAAEGGLIGLVEDGDASGSTSLALDQPAGRRRILAHGAAPCWPAEQRRGNPRSGPARFDGVEGLCRTDHQRRAWRGTGRS